MTVIWHTSVSFYTGVCITDKDTIYFEDRSAKEAFLNQQIAESLSPIRETNKSINGYNLSCIHTNLSYETLNELNVVGWKNSASDGDSALLDDRWHYGRVLDREYVNPTSCRVYFIEDYWLTYMDLIEFGESYVMRHHVHKGDDFVSDRYAYQTCGLLDEPVAVSRGYRPPFSSSPASVFTYSDINYTILAAIGTEGGTGWGYNLRYINNKGQPGYFGLDGTFSQPSLTANTTNDVRNMLAQYIINRENSPFWTDWADKSNIKDVFGIIGVPVIDENIVNVPVPTKSDIATLTNGYTVKNGKTLSSLFMSTVIQSNDGSNIELDEYDCISGNTVTLCCDVMGCETPQVLVGVRTHPGTFNMGKYFAVDCPTYAFSSDGYSDALNANAAHRMSQIVGGGIKIAGGFLEGVKNGGVGQVTAGASQAAEAMVSSRGWELNPSTRIGSANNKNTLEFFVHWLGQKKIANRWYNAPSNHDIVSVDNYFTYFGYNVSSMMIPNPGLRDKMTYIQCDPAFKKAPSNHVKDLFVSQLNNGLRFWKNGQIGEDPGEN